MPSSDAIISTVVDSGLAALAGFVPRVVGGDDAAWQELVLELEPHLIALLRRSRTLGPMRHNVDDCRAVMISVLERLKRDDFRGLRLFQPWVAANPGKDFGDWIRIVTVNLARDHVSSRLGDGKRAADDEAPRNKRMLHTLASLLPADDDHRLAFRPLMTNDQMARELMEYAARTLDPVQLRALNLWIEGASFDEVAAELDLPRPQDATRLVRAALARMRRHFGEGADD